MPRKVLLIVFILFSTCGLIADPQVLYLNSYHIGYRWSDDELRGFLDTLVPAGIRPSVEFLDMKRYPEKFDSERFGLYLQNKYGDTQPAVIVAADDAAYNFALARREELFPGVPLVFCGVNFADYSSFAELREVYGVSEEPDVRATLELMAELYPAKDHVAIITDSSISGRIVQKQIERILPAFEGRFSFTSLADLAPGDVIRRAGDLKANSLILFTFYGQDPQGHYYPYDAVLQRLLRQTQWPVWGAWDFLLGKGIVGGKLITGYAQGVQAAEIVLRLLSGETINGPQRLEQSPNAYAFDFTELKKNGIQPRDLPRESRYINRPDPLLVRYRAFFLGALGLILGLGILSIALAMKNRRIQMIQDALWRSEEELKKSNLRLEEKVKERTEELQDSLGRLQQAQDQLVESEKLQALGTLVAGIAHELNTPLGVSLTAISHLKRKMGELFSGIAAHNKKEMRLHQVLEESSEIVSRNIERSAELVRSFKQVAVDQFSGTFREYSPAEVTANLLMSIKPRLQEAEALVEVDCDPDIRLYGDPGVLLQILTNLLTNALDHGITESETKEISIEIRQIEDTIELRVSDSGIGIPEADRPHIFEPFFTTKRGAGGTGLGLHIVYNLVTSALHGRMSFVSGADGTEFIIEWPATGPISAAPRH